MPTAVDGVAAIRPTVRRHLLTRLGRLAAADPAIRAQAAVELTELVERRKLTWGMLLVPATDNGMQDTPEEWPAPVLALLEHPDLSVDDRATLDKLKHWRAPGEKGLATLRAIGAKLGIADSLRSCASRPRSVRARTGDLRQVFVRSSSGPPSSATP